MNGTRVFFLFIERNFVKIEWKLFHQNKFQCSTSEIYLLISINHDSCFRFIFIFVSIHERFTRNSEKELYIAPCRFKPYWYRKQMESSLSLSSVHNSYFSRDEWIRCTTSKTEEPGSIPARSHGEKYCSISNKFIFSIFLESRQIKTTRVREK